MSAGLKASSTSGCSSEASPRLTLVALDGAYQISTAGGHSPAWARTGRELFYLQRDPAAGRHVQDFMVVDIPSSREGSASRPRKLFARPVASTSPVRGYDVGADGRFLILTPYEMPTERVTRFQVVLNWFEQLKRLAPSEN
jgi:hypothetical protein